MGYGIVPFQAISNSWIFIIGITLSAIFRYIWSVTSFYTTKKNFGYHDYEGVVGHIEILASFAQGIWFYFCWKNTYLHSGQKYANFVRTIIISGIIFFAVRPLAI